MLFWKKIRAVIFTALLVLACGAQTVYGASPAAPPDWADNLKVAATANQILTVVANGSSATVSLHNKGVDGHFFQVLSGDATIGRNGIGKSREGDGKTPRGQYGFLFGFGIKANPGTLLSYTQVDGTCYWVDDPSSAYYNRFVSTKNVVKDWKSAENLLCAGQSYNYALALNYNQACVPGAGSAIFIHCRPTGGAGCVAVDESLMLQIVKNVQPGCVVLIDDARGIANY